MTESDIAFYADASDDTGLHAGILTGALFGCIRFETQGNDNDSNTQ